MGPVTTAFIHQTRLMTAPEFRPPEPIHLLFTSLLHNHHSFLPFRPDRFHPCQQSFFSAMLEGNAVIRETDMLQKMQQDALHLAAKALDLFDVTESTDIARFIKKEMQDFDRAYGHGWQCIVGTDYGFIHDPTAMDASSTLELVVFQYCFSSVW